MIDGSKEINEYWLHSEIIKDDEAQNSFNSHNLNMIKNWNLVRQICFQKSYKASEGVNARGKEFLFLFLFSNLTVKN